MATDAEVAGAVLGDEPGVQRDQQVERLVGETEVVCVVAGDELNRPATGVDLVDRDDLVDPLAVGEELRRSTIDVDVGDRWEGERGRHVDERSRIQRPRRLDMVGNRNEEAQTIAAILVLLRPQFLVAGFIRSR
ncbi:MAG: hypothetical protein R2761_19240 [Acidimicrobiales bacterium]